MSYQSEITTLFRSERYFFARLMAAYMRLKVVCSGHDGCDVGVLALYRFQALSTHEVPAVSLLYQSFKVSVPQVSFFRRELE
jgi:hypothetical protein